MNKYVKVEGHQNWFLLLERVQDVPKGLAKRMQEKLLSVEASTVRFKDDMLTRLSFVNCAVVASQMELDYKKAIRKHGPILIRPIGSFMALEGVIVTESILSNDFPVETVVEEVL